MKSIILVAITATVSVSVMYFGINNSTTDSKNSVITIKPPVLAKNTKKNKKTIEPAPVLQKTAIAKTVDNANSKLEEEVQILKQKIASLEEEKTIRSQRMEKFQNQFKNGGFPKIENMDNLQSLLGHGKSMQDISKELELSDYEVEELEKYEAEQNKIQQGMVKKLLSGNPEDQQAVATEMMQLRQDYKEKVTGLLGEEKAEKYSKMKGTNGNVLIHSF